MKTNDENSFQLIFVDLKPLQYNSSNFNHPADILKILEKSQLE
jgi:hypothetical protein